MRSNYIFLIFKIILLSFTSNYRFIRQYNRPN
nr:MAG TPA: hypothetical protein [Caudoviricetes sp.]